jgi:hypothetical protein
LDRLLDDPKPELEGMCENVEDGIEEYGDNEPSVVGGELSVGSEMNC